MDGPVTARLSPAHILVLARIQWTLALRLSRGSGVEKAIIWAIIVPLIGGVALACGWLGYRATAQVAEDPALLLVFLIGFGGFFLGTTLIAVPFTDRSLSGFDPSKAFHQPLTPREILLALVLGNALNPTFTIIPSGFFTGCVVGGLASGRFELAASCVAGGILWLVQFALVTLVCDFALMKLRRSRWINGVMLILFAVIFTVAWTSLGGRGGDSPSLEGLKGWVAPLSFLPGLSPLAWVVFEPGWWANLIAALLETAALLVVGARLLGSIMAEGSVEEAFARRGPRPTSPALLALVEWSNLWPHFAKDFLLLWRERNFKITLFSLAVMATAFPALTSDLSSEAAREMLHWAGPLTIIWLMGTVSFNQLGHEGAGLVLLFGSPAPRWRVVAGKNFALLAFAGATLTLSEGMVLYQGAMWFSIIADYGFALSLGLLCFGGGNIASILWPFPSSLSGKESAGKTPPARIFVISIYQFAVTLGILMIALPLFSGRYALGKIVSPGILFWVLAASMAAYALLAYGLLLACAGRLLDAREPQVFERLVQNRA